MEILGEILLNIVAYGVGRVFVAIFLPWYGIHPIDRHDPAEAHPWKWQGFSYQDGGKRVMRTESVQLIGIVVIVAVTAMIVGLVR